MGTYTLEEWVAKLDEHGKWVSERLNTTKTPLIKGCWHEWKHYDGFREKYFFCTKCDTKKESLDEIREDDFPPKSLR